MSKLLKELQRVSSKKRPNGFRCTVCGRFIGEKDFINGDIEVDFTPDTHFNEEKITYTHKNCLCER